MKEYFFSNSSMAQIYAGCLVICFDKMLKSTDVQCCIGARLRHTCCFLHIVIFFFCKYIAWSSLVMKYKDLCVIWWMGLFHRLSWFAMTIYFLFCLVHSLPSFVLLSHYIDLFNHSFILIFIDLLHFLFKNDCYYY